MPANELKPALTHSELCLIAERFLRNNGFSVAFHDRFVAAVSTGEQPDAIGFRNLASCLIEAKCSRGDFLADRKKRFRIQPELGMGDWRFFICEPGLIRIEELPEGWGLLNVKGGRVFKVWGWPGNTMWCTNKNKPFRANKQAECDYMYSALRRMQIRGHLSEVYDGFPKPQEAQLSPTFVTAGDWRIDKSAGRPILMYRDCSVIEDEQAEYVLSLIQSASVALVGRDA